MKKSAFILALLAQSLYVSWCSLAFSQFNRTKNWVLGDSVLLDFSTNPPNLDISGLRSFEEGLSIISDINGTTLFYTNGVYVWNAQHQLMPNGLYLNSSYTTSDAALIVPLPGNNQIYYIFTVGSAGGYPLSSEFGGVAYSIVDMSLQGGLGDVTQKNVIIHPSPLSTEKLCATKHANGMDYWIMTHDVGNNQFRAFLLTANGIESSSIVSKVGSVYDKRAFMGSMRFSPSGCKLATTLYRNSLDTIEIFDFDNYTGYVFNPIQLNLLGGWGQWGELPEDYPHNLTPYGLCFSPDNSKLYVSSLNFIAQFDLSSGNPLLINQSRTPIKNIIEYPYPISNFKFGAMQIAPDGKIYIARHSASFLSVINFPNNLGTSCDFVASGVSFTGYKSWSGLPNFVSNFLVPDSVSFSSCNTYCPELNVGKDTILCNADSFLIAVDLPKGTILWNHLDTSFDFTVTYSGEYFAAYDFNGCPTQYDTIRVSFVQNPLPVYADTAFCKGDTLFFTLPIESETTYLLNEAPINPLFAIDTSGNFQITAKKESCVFTTTFKVMDICDTLPTLPLDTFSVEIPNVFTPNQDGQNDVFTIQQQGVMELSFVIYNRWGNVVHSKTVKPSQKEVLIWDGGNASEGTYFYTATFISADGQQQERKGFIHLFR